MSNFQIPAFAEAPARRTRLWQAGLRAGRQISNEFQSSKESIFYGFGFNFSLIHLRFITSCEL